MPSIETIQSLQPTVLLDDVFKLHLRRSLRTKHHKSKDKHHKEKRKKRKHPKTADGNDTEIEANKHSLEVSKNEEKVPKESEDTTASANVSDSKCSVVVEKVNISTIDESIVFKTEESNSKELFVKDVNSENNPSNNLNETINTIEDEQKHNHNLESYKDEEYNNENQNSEDLYQEIAKSVDDSNLNETVNCPQPENNQERNILQYGGVEENSEMTKGDSKDSDDKKLKRKKKKLKHDGESDKGTVTQSPEDPSEELMHKHRKRKHKHVAGDHKNKKHHDVRKAPQDGIIVPEEIKETELIANGSNRIAPDMIPNEQMSENLLIEPQRLAITIKLCQDCNSRHLQDACPLTIPQYVIHDSISYEDWLNKYQDNLDVVKNVNSEDPMSDGYGKMTDDGFDSDEDSVSSEQCKLKVKEESEEKQLQMDDDKPLYSRESLPDCFELKATNSEHGLGVYAKSPVPMYAQLGPLVGIPVKEMDIPDDFSMRHIWEVIHSKEISIHFFYHFQKPSFQKIKISDLIVLYHSLSPIYAQECCKEFISLKRKLSQYY